MCGRKTRDPYDRRFGIHLHDALPGKPGATKELYEQLSRARMNAQFFITGAITKLPHANSKPRRNPKPNPNRIS